MTNIQLFTFLQSIERASHELINHRDNGITNYEYLGFISDATL